MYSKKRKNSPVFFATNNWAIDWISKSIVSIRIGKRDNKFLVANILRFTAIVGGDHNLIHGKDTIEAEQKNFIDIAKIARTTEEEHDNSRGFWKDWEEINKVEGTKKSVIGWEEWLNG